MLRSVKEITGYVLQAEDGEIGRCKDFLFDDQRWTVRYMVADTGKWLPENRVLISPTSLGEPDWASRHFPVRLRQKQIEEAPKLNEHAPVSKQHETTYFIYYGWPISWNDPILWGTGVQHGPIYPEKKLGAAESGPGNGDPHLRSVQEVSGYRIQARDGEIGHVEDFIVDDQTWTIRYMIIDTRNWLPGSRKVLVPPTWIESVEWAASNVTVDLTREQIKRGPKYDPAAPVNRAYEVRLYDFYGRPKYW